jgi:predicted nucleic acid-binding protein
MKQYIIDASVGVKWFLQDEFSEKADYFLKIAEQVKGSIIVPEFFFFEIANVCRQKVKKKSLDARSAFEELDRVMKLSLSWRRDSELIDVALENALFYNITVYDSLYISLAETYLAPLITADQKLIQACRTKGFDFIQSLEDIKLT